MNKLKKLMLRIFVLSLVIMCLTTTSFAAWWGTPGYEWCFSRGLTPAMAQSELNKQVTNERFYDILLKYLRLKNVRRRGKINRSFLGYTDNISPIFSGMAEDIDDYLRKDSLTPQEYKQVISYIDHAESNIASHLSLLNRNDAKEFALYLSLSRYKAATLISYTDVYRKTEMGKYGNVKYKDIYFYGMNPYFGKITRKEFLVLMFTILANPETFGSYSDDEIITTFNESGVLLGYDNDLWLNERITYAEMFTFLYRFEAFDFESGETVTSSSSGTTTINGQQVDMSTEDAMKLMATLLNLSLNADQYTEEEIEKQLMSAVEKYTE